MPFEEVNAVDGVDSLTWLPAEHGPPVVMLDPSSAAEPAPTLPTLWRRLPVPRVLVPVVLAALVLGAVAGAATTYALDRTATVMPTAGLQVRVDSEALAQGLDVYGLTRPALPLLITNREKTVVRVVELAWASPAGRLVWYGDASGVDPGRQARIWGESEISCGHGGGSLPGLRAYVLLPGGEERTVQLVDPQSVAVLRQTLQRACG